MPPGQTQKKQKANASALPEQDGNDSRKLVQLKANLADLSYDEQVKALTPSLPVQFNAKGKTKSTKKPVGKGDLVVARGKDQTDTDSLTDFQEDLHNVSKLWGFSVKLKDLRLATEGGKTVMVLAWKSSWGRKPITPPKGNFNALEARWVVAAVSKLPGFKLLPSGVQPRVLGLLGGETNELSRGVRETFEKIFVKIKGETPQKQATALKGLLTNKDALPSDVSEDHKRTQTKYALTGPTPKPKYAFRGKAADGEAWLAKFVDGVQITIVAPKAMKKGYHNYTAQQVAKQASYLPKANRKAIKTILLNPQKNPDDAYWAVKYKEPNFSSFMTAGAAGIVTIYPEKNNKKLKGENTATDSMIHETGHVWSRKKWGPDTTKPAWKPWRYAMAKDGVAVSTYAMKSVDEDVAETVAAYVVTQGSPKYAEYQAIVPARFALLKREYK